MQFQNSYELHRQARRWRSSEMARLTGLGSRRVASVLRQALLRLRANFRTAVPPIDAVRR